ncbi:MAG: hypothetical protein KF752_04555 [Pirellulaceae bacterium]|nr:hypothetical protein [Pirellulaceae bacterium]
MIHYRHLVRSTRGQHRQTRRGAALVLAAVLMFVLFSMLAFAIDTGYLAQARSEAIRSADSAALAGCWEVYQQLQSDPDLSMADISELAKNSANNFAQLNPICQSNPSLNPGEVQVGYVGQMRGDVISNDASKPYYAVRVKLHKNEDLNGSVPFFFGRIFGNTNKNLVVESTAVMARSVSGFNLPAGSTDTLNVLPFALDQQTWDNMLTAAGGSGSDNYRFNALTNTVSPGSDGILEVNLFPQGTGSPGNRGTVDIGSANNSTNDIKRQILHGISHQDLIALGKPLALDSFTGTMTLNGDTGISAAVKDQFDQIIGQKRIIPLFSQVSGNGNNAMYTITRWVGVRIMFVKLTGSMSSKQVIVQPAPVIATYGTRSTNSQSSNYVMKPVTLAE